MEPELTVTCVNQISGLHRSARKVPNGLNKQVTQCITAGSTVPMVTISYSYMYPGSTVLLLSKQQALSERLAVYFDSVDSLPSVFVVASIVLCGCKLSCHWN